MFNVTEKKGTTIRFLNGNSTLDERKNAYKKMSMNISDINSTYLEMYIIPGEDRHLNTPDFPFYKLNFTWEIVYFRYNFMKIQLYFNDSSFISTGSIWDIYTLRIKHSHANLFYSKHLEESLNPDYY